MAGAAVQELLHQAVGVGDGGPAHTGHAMVQAQAATDQVHGHGAEEAADGVGAAGAQGRTGQGRGAGAGGQEPEAQLAQQRQAPPVVRRAGARFTLGTDRGRRTELRPVLAQAVPRLGDGLVEAFARRQAVVLDAGAGELLLGVQHMPQQIGRQQAALGADGLYVGGAARHNELNRGNRT
jgi:hypothetical protein